MAQEGTRAGAEHLLQAGLTFGQHSPCSAGLSVHARAEEHMEQQQQDHTLHKAEHVRMSCSSAMQQAVPMCAVDVARRACTWRRRL